MPRFLGWSLGWVGALFGLELVAVLLATGGRFTYSLDDPYIHLALAENIARGHYGISKGVVASPSSSVLWPFLLAPFAGGSLGHIVPLALNLLCLGGLTVAVGSVVQSCFAWLPERGKALLTILLVVTMNGIGLPFTGMEHSAQILAAFLGGMALIRTMRGEAWPWPLVAALLVGPCVRYENLAVTAAASLLLLLSGAARRGVLLSLGALAPVFAFSLFLVSLGLDPIPCSVRAKTGVPAGSGTFAWVQEALARAFTAVTDSNRGLWIALLAGVLLAFGFLHPELSRRRLAWVTALIPLLHLGFGQYGWFGRYEVYVLAGVTPALLLLLSEVAGRRSTWVAPVVCGFYLLGGLPYLLRTAQTPFAARSILTQQGSTKLFARALAEPIAVNDLGLVAYQSPHPVLDLWGLGSPDALSARLKGEPLYPARLLDSHGVEVAAVYESWFIGQISPQWVPVARIVQTAPEAIVVDRNVAIFATNAPAQRRARAALEAVRESLPPDVRIDWSDRP